MSAMNPNAKSQEKKSYHAPRIQEYGNIRLLTQAVTLKGVADGGTGNRTKTKA